ncbi:hypothetical protein J2045_003355 [Peteryoungia aggregata LMG 23059]|uniref:Uncharacterized protein n=1 Tax=Peteryoungia aggregata LMG 23059 TaxID=1368425 RepID=A0ABU0GAC5_9HYPH|nr:hypothetical protein [Peteryoungia aggregata]MDQ0422307.1 hypothetical protein [Peteryoungia aggregata LMG 23059]
MPRVKSAYAPDDRHRQVAPLLDPHYDDGLDLDLDAFVSLALPRASDRLAYAATLLAEDGTPCLRLSSIG